MTHYFKDREPHYLNATDGRAEFKRKIEDFFDIAKGEIEAWSERGSGWINDSIQRFYINISRHEPFRGCSFIATPKNWSNKKAIINVKNRDDECLKWSLRAALFPPNVSKNLERTSKYPTNDGINYTGIIFPTPLSQIAKLEKQNPHLAINVFGWEN